MVALLKDANLFSMNYAYHFFNKPLEEITAIDLKAFLTEKPQEGAFLEFKGGEVAFEKVAREVAGFLNTQGGLIIVGYDEQKGQLKPDKNKKGTDLLHKILNLKIEPAPQGIECISLSFESGLAYIINVPPSNEPPHQMKEDSKYYIRFEDQTRPAQHEMVKSMFRQQSTPDLSIQLKQLETSNNGNNGFNFTLSLINKSEIPCERLTYRIRGYNMKSLGFEETENLIIHDQGQSSHHYIICEIPMILTTDIEMQIKGQIEPKLNWGVLGCDFWSKANNAKTNLYKIDFDNLKVMEEKEGKSGKAMEAILDNWLSNSSFAPY